MHWLYRPLSAAAFMAIMASSAMAQGSLACVIEDKVVSLALTAPYAAGHGDGLIDVSGKMGVKYDGTPRDIGTVALQRQSVAQYWFQGKELKLLVVEDKAGIGRSLSVTIRLDLKGSRTDPTTYRGAYVMEAVHRDRKTTGAGLSHKASGYAECTANPNGG